MTRFGRPAVEPRLRRPVPPRRFSGVRLPLSVCAPVIGRRELSYVTRCVKSGWISSLGPMVGEFERLFAARLGARDAVACSSGTSALHLALMSAGVGPGDEVILPAFTMIAVCNAVLYCGARPVLVDCDPAHWTMDPAAVERRLTRRTRAIIAVHTYGQPAPMAELSRLARRAGAALVEDGAECLGGSENGRAVGRWGAASSFSLYANKLITTGEGGVVVLRSRAAARRVRILRDHGFSPRRHFWHEVVGFNYRMTSLQAAVGLAQLERFDELMARRRRLASLYGRGLAAIGGLSTARARAGTSGSHWVFPALVERSFGRTRDALRAALAARGVETRAFFVPIHQQPAHRALFRGESYPVSEDLGRRGLYLPSSSSLRDDEVAYVLHVLEALRR